MIEVLDNRALVFKTRSPAKYEIIPKSKAVPRDDGGFDVAVHWGLDECRVLKNLGVKNVPSPIYGRYDWPGRYKPMDHQKSTASFLTLHRRAFVFSEPGTGKTLSAAWAADYLMTRGEVRRVLIICPVSIMHTAWVADMSNSIIHRSVVVAHHAQAARRVELIQENHEIVVINYEGVGLVAQEIKNDGRFDLIIVDEANAYKNTSTKRWKALAALIKPETYLWMMTGTPSSQSPMDAYGLARLVNPNGVPRFLTAWRDQTMNKITMFKWAPKFDAPEKIHKALQPAIRYTKAECLDLPPVVTTTREVALTPQQAKYYNLLKTQLLVQTAGQTITAVNAAAALNKLLQISCGVAYSDDKEVIEFDASPRLNVLLEALEQTERKVLVFALYRAAIETIAQFLAKHGIEAEQIHGGVPASKRAHIIDRFQNHPNPRVLVLQPQAAAHGITLTAADTVIFYGPLMSVEQYIQAIARSDRKGQNSDKVTVIHIEGSPVEKRMFKALSGKVDDQTLVVEMFNAEIKERGLPARPHL
jgi:SNF2 family DNA or RNA helicase